MDRLFVIPTETEGSHGTPVGPTTEKILEPLDFSTPLETTRMCHPDRSGGISRLKLDLFETAEPMLSDLARRTRFA